MRVWWSAAVLLVLVTACASDTAADHTRTEGGGPMTAGSVGSGHAPDPAGPDPSRTASTGPSGDNAGEGTDGPVAPEFEGVIIDLDVAWRPSSDLPESERREQRDRIEVAQDQVIDDLGSHGELRRRLTETAQMSLGVDAEGREILEHHELVKAVHEDTPAAPAGAGAP